MNNAAKAYLQTQVTTTTQADILLLLYDGAIKFLNRAKDKIAENDVVEKGNLITRALDIINELQCSLNKEKGGELAENLNRLYFFCSSRLLMANLKMDTKAIDDVIRILSDLRSAFAEAKAANPDCDRETVTQSRTQSTGAAAAAATSTQQATFSAQKAAAGYAAQAGQASQVSAARRQSAMQAYGRK